MKTSLALVLFSVALWLPNAMAAAPTRKLKGAKGARRARYLQEEGSHDHEHKEKKILDGPTARSCDYEVKMPSDDRNDAKKASANSQQVKFTCKANEAVADENSMSRGITLDPLEIRDKIQYKVKTGDKGISVKVEYANEYVEEEGVDEYTDTKTSFEVVFESIIEYAKGDNDVDRTDEEQAYDWGSDIIVQSISLTDWANFTNVTDSDDGVLSYFSVESMDSITEFNFTISRAEIGEKVTANTMKIDVRIINFPWLRDDTNLALMSTVRSELKVEMTYSEQAEVRYDPNGNEAPPSKWTENVYISFEDAERQLNFVPFGDYTWDDLATATKINSNASLADMMDAFCQSALLEQWEQQSYSRSFSTTNATLPPGCEGATLAPETIAMIEDKDSIVVIGTSPPVEDYGNETRQQIAYSFVGPGAQGAREIYWDPEAGIGYTSSAGSNSPYFNTASTATTLRSILTSAIFFASGLCYLLL